jgi:hypothetical protein
VLGRSHATRHHFVAERFFGRSTNRRDTTEGLFAKCPWGLEGRSEVFCYECHEELLHNPVLLPGDVQTFAELVARRGFDEAEKSTDRSPLAGRVRFLQEVIARGLDVLTQEARETDHEEAIDPNDVPSENDAGLRVATAPAGDLQ